MKNALKIRRCSPGQSARSSKSFKGYSNSIEVGGCRRVRAPFAARVILHDQICGRLPAGVESVPRPTREHIPVLAQLFSGTTQTDLREIPSGAIAAHLENRCDVLAARRGDILARNHAPIWFVGTTGRQNSYQNQQVSPHQVQVCRFRGEIAAVRHSETQRRQVAKRFFLCVSAPLRLCV